MLLLVPAARTGCRCCSAPQGAPSSPSLTRLALAAGPLPIMVISARARDAAGDIPGMSRLACGVDWARVRASLGHSFGFTSAYFSLFLTGDFKTSTMQLRLHHAINQFQIHTALAVSHITCVHTVFAVKRLLCFTVRTVAGRTWMHCSSASLTRPCLGPAVRWDSWSIMACYHLGDNH